MKQRFSLIFGKLRSRKGSFYTDFLIGILIFFSIIALAMSILPVYTQKNMLDGLADDVARYVELVGYVKDDEITKLTKGSDGQSGLAATYGLNPENLTVTVTPNNGYYKVSGGKGMIQIMEPFTVSASYNTSIGIDYYAVVPITLQGKAVGRSEVYWK